MQIFRRLNKGVVSAGVPELWRRRPADQFHYQAGDDSENSEAPG